MAQNKPLIGVGIKTYRRRGCIERLLESLRRTDEFQTGECRVVIGDDTDRDTEGIREYLSDQKDVKVIFNNPRKGIASNTNTLLRDLLDCKWIVIMDDDTEVIRSGWSSRLLLMDCSRILHTTYFQDDLWGMRRKRLPRVTVGDQIMLKSEKPMGQIQFYHRSCIDKIGYYDSELFPCYGYEHVDYSNRLILANVVSGYYDFEGSQEFWKSHKVNSAVSSTERYEGIKRLKQEYLKVKDNKERVYIPYKG